MRGGRRWSSADAHLDPALKRPNLRLNSNALVQRIETDQRRAIGVRSGTGDRSCVAHARGEVVLFAGAVNSPQLLQLSGVGPAGLLMRHGFNLRHALAEVGRGVQDHLGVSHMLRATEPTLSNRLGRRPGRLAAGLRHQLSRNGPPSVPVNQLGGFVRSNVGVVHPDLLTYCNPMSYLGQSCLGRGPVSPARPEARAWTGRRGTCSAPSPAVRPVGARSASPRQIPAIR